MDRTEMRAVIRRMLTPEQSGLLTDLEINSIINQGLAEMAKEVGGENTSATLTTDADGFATLPTDIIEIFRMEYDGTRMGRISFDEILELEEST